MVISSAGICMLKREKNKRQLQFPYSLYAQNDLFYYGSYFYKVKFNTTPKEKMVHVRLRFDL